MSRRLERVWVSSDAKKALKLHAAKCNKSMSDAFDDLVSDSKKGSERWGKLF